MKQQYTATYDSPLGEIVLAACEDGLTGLWFAGQKYFGSTLNGTEKPWQDDLQASAPAVSEIFARTRQWLDLYFSGKNPDFTPPLALEGSPFRLLIWNLLLEIPYGQTTTYGELARKAAQKLGRTSMSAQAVGNAVGHNPVSLIVPCHRVKGADGSLTGYAGGIDRKQWLLNLEL